MQTTITRDLADSAACALRALLTACKGIQTEQPARTFLHPAAATEIARLAAALECAANVAG